MRGLVVGAGASALCPGIWRRRAERLWVPGLIVAWGLLVLGPLSLGGVRPSGPGIAFWSWVFGASGCLRASALWAERGRARWPVPRLVSAVLGLMAWSQLSWLVLRRVSMPEDAADAGMTMAGFMVYASVGVVELRAIYRAAKDARFHAV